MAGGLTVDGDGVRGLQAGPLSAVPPAAFPKGFDYVALGHLHSPQTVGDDPTIRYSGAPIPMGFGEAGQPKSVALVELEPGRAEVELVRTPIFQELRRLEGDLPTLLTRISELKASDSKAWLELIHVGSPAAGDVRGELETALAGSAMEVLAVRDVRAAELAMASWGSTGSLDLLTEEQVFERLLESRGVPEEERAELRASHAEILRNLLEEDASAD
jgi:exonuclease SbcD